MTYSEVFEINNSMVILNKDVGETREQFLIRAHFIVRNISKDELSSVINMSYLFLNIKFFENKYDQTVENKLSKYDCSII
jgi:hypothetical protein